MSVLGASKGVCTTKPRICQPCSFRELDCSVLHQLHISTCTLQRCPPLLSDQSLGVMSAIALQNLIQPNTSHQDQREYVGWQHYPIDLPHLNPITTSARACDDLLTSLSPKLFCDELKVRTIDIETNNGMETIYFVIRYRRLISLKNDTDDIRCKTSVHTEANSMATMLGQKNAELPRIRIMYAGDALDPQLTRLAKTVQVCSFWEYEIATEDPGELDAQNYDTIPSRPSLSSSSVFLWRRAKPRRKWCQQYREHMCRRRLA